MRVICNRVSGEDFIIQRYAMTLWPRLRGHEPFIVRGPGWYRRHALRNVLLTYDLGPGDPRELVAELMLREQIVLAYWSIDMVDCAPPEKRWELSIKGCANEIPVPNEKWPIHYATWELLDGMSSIEFYKSHVWHDALPFESVQIPNDI